MDLYRLFIGVLFVYAHAALASNTVKNKHELQVKQVTSCDTNKGTGDIRWDFRLKRKSRNLVVMEGNISMAVDLDSSVGATINVQERGNGGWIDSSYVFIFKDMCKDFGEQYVEPAWSLLWTKAGLQPPIKCPIAKGDYFLQEYPVEQSPENTTFYNQEQFTDEKILYKAIIEFFRNSDKEILGCVNFIISF